jgi:hypothetical protein
MQLIETSTPNINQTHSNSQRHVFKYVLDNHYMWLIYGLPGNIFANIAGRHVRSFNIISMSTCPKQHGMQNLGPFLLGSPVRIYICTNVIYCLTLSYWANLPRNHKNKIVNVQILANVRCRLSLLRKKGETSVFSSQTFPFIKKQTVFQFVE